MRLTETLRMCRAVPGLILVFCALPAAFGATRTVSDTDRGATIHLKVGDELVVRLTSNAATGYSWSLDPSSFAAQLTPLLKLAGQTQIRPKQPGVGRPAMDVFRFAAVARGEGQLMLRYARPWEKPSPDDQKFDLYIVIPR